MNNRQRGKRAGAGRLLALGALLCVATGLGGARAAGAEPPAPAQLRMTLSPGRADASTITFSTEDGKRTRGELEQVFAPEPEGQAAGRIEAAAPPDPLWGGRKTAADIAYQPEVSLRAGYRRDHLQWSIADVDNNPNVLSELDFDHVDSLALAGDLRWSNSSKLFLRGAFDIGWRQNGNVQDSDYLGNDRTMEFSRSYADVEGGSFFDLSAGLGYRFDIPLRAEERVLRLIPLAGYSYHSQEFEITNGYQALAEYGFKAKPGPIRGLHSWYDAKWYGPWLGLDVDFSVNRRHALLLSLEYHWIDYEHCIRTLHSPDLVLQVQQLLRACHRLDRFQKRPPVLAAQQFQLGLPSGIAHGQAKEKAVQLRFRQGEGAVLLDRILGGDDEKGLRQRPGLALDTHLPFFHGLQQGALALGRGPVDFVGQKELGKNRPLAEDKLAAVAVKDRAAQNVPGQQIARALHPLVREPKAAAQGLGEHGFTQTGHVFDEQMAPGEQAAQGQLDLLVLPQDDAVDLCQHPTEQGTGICLRRGA